MNISEINELDFNNVGSWPLPLRLVAIAIIAAAVLFAGYWFDTKEQLEVLDNARAKEQDLKQQFETKQAVAANLEAYRKQMQEIERTFGALLLKLPSQTEIAELLVDISRVGLNSGLEFDLFKPESEVPKEFYAEFPIKIQVNGTYHQLGNFASGIAALPRIVTLHNLAITRDNKKGSNKLIMKATANTYRYLDKDEVRANKKKKKRR